MYHEGSSPFLPLDGAPQEVGHNWVLTPCSVPDSRKMTFHSTQTFFSLGQMEAPGGFSGLVWKSETRKTQMTTVFQTWNSIAEPGLLDRLFLHELKYIFIYFLLYIFFRVNLIQGLQHPFLPQYTNCNSTLSLIRLLTMFTSKYGKGSTSSPPHRWLLSGDKHSLEGYCLTMYHDNFNPIYSNWVETPLCL